MKKTKFAMLLVMVLVFALQSVGMMPAGAEGTAAWTQQDVTLGNLLDGLGEAAYYGVTAETMKSTGHSEASLYVDKLVHDSDPIFASGKAIACMNEDLLVVVELPEIHLGEEMTFGLYTFDGTDYVATKYKTTANTSGQTEVTLNFGKIEESHLLAQGLYVFQIENDVIVPNAAHNLSGMKVEYGPAIESGNRLSSYIGHLEQPTKDTVQLFQNWDTEYEGPFHGLELGKDVRLYYKDETNPAGYTMMPDSSGEALGFPVKPIYIYDANWGKNDDGTLKAVKLNNEGEFTYDGKEYLLYSKDHRQNPGPEYQVTVKYYDDNGRAANLLDNPDETANDLVKLSANLAAVATADGAVSKLKPGMMLGSTPNSEGGSTLAGPKTDGMVVSMYAINAGDGDLNNDDLMQIVSDPSVDNQSAYINDRGVPIADNEYIVFNVTVPNGVDKLNLKAQLALINENGVKDFPSSDYKAGKVGSHSRVIWNFVDENGAPYKGTVSVGPDHGGMVLVPAGSIVVDNVTNNVSLVAKYVEKNNQEIHQMSLGNARTFVRMINEPTTKVHVEKVWNDNNDQAKVRPESITIHLYAKVGAADKQLIKTIALPIIETAADGEKVEIWEVEIDKLPKTANGVDVVYSIEEVVDFSYYKPSYTVTSDTTTDPAHFDLQVKNTYDENTLAIAGTKTWDDADNQDGLRPKDGITVRLQYRYIDESYINNPMEEYWWSQWDDYDFEYWGPLTEIDFDGQTNPIQVTAENNWSWAFSKLPAKTSVTNNFWGNEYTTEYVWEYRVVEDKVDGYNVVYSNDGDHTKTPGGKYNITNTHVPEKIKISGSKVWHNKDGVNQPNEVTVRLYTVDDKGAETYTGKEIRVNAGMDWKWSFDNLDKCANGKDIIYRVKEEPVNGYYTEYVTDEDGNIVIHNYVKTVKLFGTKKWVLPENTQWPPVREVEIFVYRQSDNKLMTTTKASMDNNNWAWSVELPGVDPEGNPATYYIEESPVPNYKAEVTPGTSTENADGKGYTAEFTVTNCFVPISFTVNKVWNDCNNVFGLRPAKLVFYLQSSTDGVNWSEVKGSDYQAIKKTIDINSDKHEYKVTFENLNAWFDAETKYQYRVVEKFANEYNNETNDMFGYEAVTGTPVTDTKTGDISVTMTNGLKGTLSGKKEWKGDRENDRPDTITLNLVYKADENTEAKVVATTTATKANKYAWEFTGLPANLSEEELAKFTVVEGVVAGYVSTPGTAENDFTVTNTKSGVTAETTVEKIVETDGYNSVPDGLEFTFQMKYSSGPDGYQLEGADVTGSKVTTAVIKYDSSKPKNEAKFKLSFNEEGTYTFKVSEVVDKDKTGNIKYDRTVYTVTYKVTSMGRNLFVTTEIKKDSKPAGNEMTFTNKYAVVSIGGEKLWSGLDTSERLPITAENFKDTYLKLYTLTKDTENKDVLIPVNVKPTVGTENSTERGTYFRWFFNGLPWFDANGNDLQYVVKEMTVNGYQTFYINPEGKSYRVGAEDALYPMSKPQETGLTIHNTLAKSSLEITKKVAGENAPKVDEFQFTITPDANTLAADGYTILDKDGNDDGLYTLTMDADGINGKLEVEFLFDDFCYDEKVPTTSQQKDDKGNAVSESKTFTFIVGEAGADNPPSGWTYDDAKTVTFTVTRNADDYTVTVVPEKATASFTNTYKEEEKTSVTVKKVWHTAGGEIAPAEKQYDVTEFLELYVLTTDSDGNEKLTLVKDADGKVLRPVQQPLLKGEGTYDYTWSDLPKLKDGEQYVVKEDLEALYAKHPGYCANYDYNRDDYANAEEGYLVTNQVFMANVELAARKLVDGKMPELAKRFSFVVKNLTTNEEHIFKNEDAFVGEDNSLIDVFIKYGPEDQPAPGTTTVYEYVMYEVDPKDDAYIYDKAQFKFQATIDFNGKTTIKVWNEEKQAYVDDLAINAPAFTFNNKTVTSVIITKFWANETFASKDKVPNIADKLTLCKLVNGNPVKVENAPTPAHEATDADRSVYTWSGLPMYDENGNAIEYVVVEQKMPGYEQYYFGADGRLIDGGTYAPNGGAIDNEWQTTDVIITKVWVGVPPVDSDISNDLVLYANGKHVNEAPEKDGNRYAWYDLPEYDENGKLITYTVKESGIPGYVVSYEPLRVGEDADQEKAKDFAFAGETITNTYYETKGKVEFDGVKVLKGRDMKAGEFTFILTDVHGNEIQSVTNAADGSFTFDAIEFTTEDVPYGESLPAIYHIYEAKGGLPGMTYDPTEYVIELLLTDNKAGEIIVEPVGGSLPEIKFTNTYEEKVYEAKGEVEFDGVKVLNGRDMKAGEFTFILTDKAGKELQRVTNAADGTFAFEPIKYTEKDVPYGKDAEFTYYITELAGNLPGVTYDTTKYEIVVGLWDDAKGTIHVGDISECVNEIVFTNTYEAEGSVTFKGAKSLLGREFKQGDEFTFELLNEKGDVIDTVTINPTSGTKADFAFKTIKYELADAGKTYTYTYRVKEKAGAEEGMTYDDTVHTVTVKVSDAGDGTLKVEASKNADALNFTNTYLAEGTVLFSGTKTMNGKALEGKDFTFVLTDADGKEIETVTNDKDGKIVFSAIQYKLEDAGKTFTYKVSEKNDGKKSVTYDDTVYTVTVKVEDSGNGHLKVTASDNATKLNFTNSYEAKAVLTMNAYKTVNGYKPSVNQVYDFVLLCDDGTEMKAQNKDEVITFGTIGFDEEDVGKTFIYTVKETTEANELLDVDAAIYKVAVTVVDNGDGNLKLETEILKDGKRANGVVFANTATATLAISKTVKGPGPDKAFDLKVTFIGVDGKELEGVYDYDGDVKGTITSGGVIALKDGQSVTIVGLPEGATYTVEENAGPAYTVTVNGKPIAKAEGTLVGHGKLEFINTVEVTTFSVTKVWEGTDLGEITLTLYADGKQITPQPEVTREGDKYTYYNLPKYNEEGEEIVYSAKERGIDGYIRIYNNVEPYQDVTSVVHDGGTIINREIEEEVHELSFKIHKVWTGVEATEEIPAITLTLYCNGEKLDVPTPKPDSEGWYRYYDLPKTVNGQIAVYTVVEEPIPGYTVTYKTASGEVVEEGVNGGEIINAKIPQTGDPATLGLWLALMGASAVLLTMLQRRRKA